MRRVTHELEDSDRMYFSCPRCDDVHVFNASTHNWNRNYTNPTLSPSVLVTGFNKDVQIRCHSFVKDGYIQFLDDCSHDKAGTTVELPKLY